MDGDNIYNVGTRDWTFTGCLEELGDQLPLFIDEANNGTWIHYYIAHLSLRRSTTTCARGDIVPSLLTANEAWVERIKQHPLLEWKAQNVWQHKGRQ